MFFLVITKSQIFNKFWIVTSHSKQSIAFKITKRESDGRLASYSRSSRWWISVLRHFSKKNSNMIPIWPDFKNSFKDHLEIKLATFCRKNFSLKFKMAAVQLNQNDTFVLFITKFLVFNHFWFAYYLPRKNKKSARWILDSARWSSRNLAVT
jgi:hypothetical protein